jgi:sarcosine oxidase subunit beta
MGMTETEILIIGGGIAGASTAYHLAQYGRQVTLLERHNIASEASGVNAGAIGAIGWGHVPNLESYLTMGSLEIFKSLQVELGDDIEFRRSGSLQAIQTEAEYTYIQRRVLELRSQGYTVDLLSIQEARMIEPGLSPALFGCLWMPLRAQADPIKATQALASAAERRGAHILLNHEVTAIQSPSAGRYQVETSQGSYQAAIMVIAAGAWCGHIGAMLGLRIPIVPVRGQMWASEPQPPRLFQTISAAESSLYWHISPGNDDQSPPYLTHRGHQRLTRHLYGRQTRTGEIIFGGDRQLVEYQKTPDPAGIEVNHRHAAEVLPFLRELSTARTWAGLMPFSLDGAPMIGRIALYPQLYIVSGLASSGFGRGPMAGQLLADYIHTGHRPHVLVEADPARCVTLAT